MDAQGIFDAVESHALSVGVFERVNTHEPKNAPGSGVTASIWVEDIRPVKGSGLDSTSVQLTLNIRCQGNAFQEPMNQIDPSLLRAVDVLMAAYSADFDLGLSAVRNIDLLGENGPGLSAKAGYITQDNKVYRMMLITLPIVCNDIWTQTP